MHGEQLTRRLFLQGSGAAASQSLLRAALPGVMALAQAACSARDEGAAYALLDTDVAAEFAAIAARIIPTTETPGASEAGVIYFMDQAFGSLMRDDYPRALTALADFQREVAAEFAGRTHFAELSAAQQDRFLAAREESPLFQLLHRMTIYGYFGMQSYGGNRDGVGWQLLGFEGKHAWQPPFGYYDAEYLREAKHGQ